MDAENSTEAVMEAFNYSHLPTYLQMAVIPLTDLAMRLYVQKKPSAHRDRALRKLLEARDALIQATEW
jgi:hypothetical protein